MTGSALKAVFLDRDGVLNKAIVRDGKPYPPASLDQLEILDGARDLCLSLKRAGYVLICVTNQPDVARGDTSIDEVNRLNDRLRECLPLDDIRVCMHDDKDNCPCRKPRPGLLVQAAIDHDLDLEASFMIGDRWRDIEAGAAAGCRTIFVDYAYRERRPEGADFETASLRAATEWIMAHSEPSEGIP